MSTHSLQRYESATSRCIHPKSRIVSIAGVTMDTPRSPDSAVSEILRGLRVLQPAAKERKPGAALAPTRPVLGAMINYTGTSLRCEASDYARINESGRLKKWWANSF